MTTIVNPGGTPSPVYNRSGKTLYTITGGASGGNPPMGNNGTPITSYSEHTMITFVNDPSNTTGPAVFPAVGDSILSFPASTGTNQSPGYSVNTLLGATFIKVTSTNWQPF